MYMLAKKLRVDIFTRAPQAKTLQQGLVITPLGSSSSKFYIFFIKRRTWLVEFG